MSAGKVRYVGLSEVSPAEIRLCHSIVPISVVELEWSLFTRDAEVWWCWHAHAHDLPGLPPPSCPPMHACIHALPWVLALQDSSRRVSPRTL